MWCLVFCYRDDENNKQKLTGKIKFIGKRYIPSSTYKKSIQRCITLLFALNNIYYILLSGERIYLGNLYIRILYQHYLDTYIYIT